MPDLTMTAPSMFALFARRRAKAGDQERMSGFSAPV
jgi:hypothetical protein